MSKETYKTIFEGFYEVSDVGNVRSVAYLSSGANRVVTRKEPRMLSQETTHDGYKRVVLSILGKHKHYSVHRLVAMAFIPNPKSLPQVNHIDENPANNRADNLEWCDGKHNCNHGQHRHRIAVRQTNNPIRSRAVCQFDMDWNWIKTYPSTREAERQTGVACEQISRCCKGMNNHAGHFRWKYENSDSDG